MKFICHLLLITCLAFLPAYASAAVISRDWKAPGDGLLTYDTVNKREWLDLSESLLFQFSGTVSERVAEAIGETGSGGMFEGFSPATANDVRLLAESSGINTSTNSHALNQVAADNLIDLLGPTITISPTRRISLGYLLNFPQASSISTSTNDNTAGYRTGTINLDLSGILNGAGVWFFQAVPEPTGLCLVGSGLFYLLMSRRIH